MQYSREFVLLENLSFLRSGSVALKITKAALFTQDNENSQVLPSFADEQIHAETIRGLSRESSVGSKTPQATPPSQK